ncbi:MAG: hypothetical protein Kow0042_04850 [Calditrichia bacterium]
MAVTSVEKAMGDLLFQQTETLKQFVLIYTWEEIYSMKILDFKAGNPCNWKVKKEYNRSV